MLLFHSSKQLKKSVNCKFLNTHRFFTIILSNLRT